MGRKMLGVWGTSSGKALGEMNDEELHAWAMEVGEAMHKAMVEQGIVPDADAEPPAS